MFKFKNITLSVGLLTTFTSVLYAFNIQCQKIDNTNVKQCISTGKKATKLFGITNMPYALCSKALCTLDKKHPHHARCVCELYKNKQGWKSLSISPTNYTKSKPTFDKQHHLTTVQSNFSMVNIATSPNKNGIMCRFKKPSPWANCFGVRCTVTGSNTATCLCPIVKNKTFSITGPGTTKKCLTKANHVWSATTLSNTSTNSEFVTALYQKLYPHSPVNQTKRK